MDRLGPYLLGPNNTPENGIYTGDARELAKAIPDESVDLIFTDPPYPKKYNEAFVALAECGRTLKDGRRLMTLLGHYQLPTVIHELSRVLTYDWIIAQAAPGKNAAMFQKRVWAGWKPCLVFRNGTINGRFKFALDIYSESDGMMKLAKKYHKWGQGAGFFAYYINRWTLQGDVILDPFVGGGTIPAVCKILRRKYLAFEIDPDTAEMARERVRMTQPPLFVPEPQQQPLFAQDAPG